MWPFKRKKRATPQSHDQRTATFAARHWPLDHPILAFNQTDHLTIRDLCEGLLVIGNTGSGKSSTTGTMIPLAALQHGWGIIAYTTKPDDAAFWQELCRKTGRESQLRIIRPDGHSRFNLIRYELERPTAGGGNTLKLAWLLMEIFREGKQVTAATESSEFFSEQGRILLCNTIDLLRLAGEPVTFRTIGRLIESMPKHPLDLEEGDWHNSFSFNMLRRADERSTTPDQRDLNEIVSGYWLHAFPSMNERTRGDILATVEGALFQLNRSPVRQLLDSPDGCSFFPEMLEQGAVIVIDCPTSVHGAVGRMLTICFKRLAKEMMRRRTVQGDSTRPILNFCDECQTYVTRDDAEFQQVCRSNRVVTVFLTQSVDNLEAVLGNGAHMNSLANALTCHVYHCTSGKTAQWIEQRIANAWREMESVNYPGLSHETPHQRPPSLNLAEGLHPQVLASDLAKLLTGGPRNNGLVDAIVFKPGRIWSSGAPFVRVRFHQS